MPGQQGAEFLPLTKVGQDGAGGAVHAVEGIARVRAPAGSQKLGRGSGGLFEHTHRPMYTSYLQLQRVHPSQ